MNYKLLILRSKLFRYYKYYSEIKKTNIFLAKYYSFLSSDELAKVKKKYRQSWIKYQMGTADFFRLHCEDKSMLDISKYLPYRESALFCREVNSIKAQNLLNNKYECYKHFSAYYGRRVEIISLHDIDTGLGLAKLKKIAGNRLNQSCIIKPLNMNCGQGVKVMCSFPDILNYVKEIGGGIVEELIIQDESLAAFNESSVNTLRIHTANFGNGIIDVLWPCLRIGRAGSVVDNAGAGGVFSAIDVTTGMTTAAIDESRNVWKVHPDSKKELIGFTIPKWQDAVLLAKELAQKIPNAGFVAWDLALTKNGWVMVEGNSSPLIIYQIAIGKGIRNEFNIMKNKFVKNRKYAEKCN